MMLEENKRLCQIPLESPKTEEYIELEELAKKLRKHNERKMTIIQKASGTPKKATEEPEISDVEMTDTAADAPSKFGKFGWHEIEGTVLPYLTRINPDMKLVSRRMAKVKIFIGLNKFFGKEILNCLTMHPIPATAAEASLLNDINQNHSDNCYGAESFREKDSLLLLTDITEMVEFLRYCCYVFDNGLAVEKIPCGFMKIGHETVPYVVKDDKRYMPLFYFDGDIKSLEEKAVEISGWTLPYVKLLCKIQGVRSEFFEGSSIKCVHLDYLKTFFPPDTPFEETWPTENKLAFRAPESPPTQHLAQAQTPNFPVPPPNPPPNLPVPPPNISPNFPGPPSYQTTNIQQFISPPNVTIINTPRMSPSTVNAQRMSPSTINVQRMSPSTANAQRMSPSTANAQRMSPSTANAQRMSPSSVKAPRSSPSTANAHRISPSIPNLQRISPPTANVQRILPPIVNTPVVSRSSRQPPPYSQPSSVTVAQTPRLRDIRRSPNDSVPPRNVSNLTNGTTHNRYQHNRSVLPDSTTNLGYKTQTNRANRTNPMIYGQPAMVMAPTYQVPAPNNYIGQTAAMTPSTYEIPSRNQSQFAYNPPLTDNDNLPTGGKFSFMYDPSPTTNNHILQGTILTNDACLIECINNPQIEAGGVTVSIDQVAKVYFQKAASDVLGTLMNLRVRIYRPTQHQSQLMRYSRFEKAYGMVNVTDLRKHLKVLKILLP